jgi:sporulation protein YlmC with PRC-barrel domain
MNFLESGRAHPKLAVIVAAVALALGSQAQEPRENANRPGEQTQIARSDAGMQTLEQYLQNNTLRVSQLVGMELQTRTGENLAEVEEVIRGAAPGQDLELVVQTGGVGADEKLVAIPFDEVQINADGDELYTSRTRESLASAAAIQLDRRTTGNQVSPAARDADDEPRAAQPAAPGAARGGAAASTSANDRRLGDLVGAEVTGADGEAVGEVDDIVISMAGANQVRAVLQVGGIAGIGEKRVAVPFNELTVERTGDGSPTLRVAMDQDGLERLPEFEYEEDTSAL